MTANASQLSLLTVEQCAELLQCSASQIERFIRAGELKRVPLSIREAGKGPQGPKCWRIKPSSLAEFVAARESFEPQLPSTARPAIPLVAPTWPGAKVTGSDGKKRLKI